MYLVVGLGNPGEEYENTPHNLGFRVIDLLAERHSIRVNRKDSKSLTGVGFSRPSMGPAIKVSVRGAAGSSSARHRWVREPVSPLPSWRTASGWRWSFDFSAALRLRAFICLVSCC